MAGEDETDGNRENEGAADSWMAEQIAGHRRLHEISHRLIPTDDVRSLYGELVDAAIEITGADCGTMQQIDPDSGDLLLIEARGLPDNVIEFSRRVMTSAATTCAAALREGKRVVLDYLDDPDVKGTEEARLHLEIGIRVAQSTPLVARSGQTIGVLTTHWKSAHQPPQHTLELIDILARQVADLIERREATSLRDESEEFLRLATAAGEIGLHDFDPSTGIVKWDARTRAFWGVGENEPITFELWRDSIHPADLDQAEVAVQRALEPSGSGRYEAEYRITNREDGRERWILALGQSTFVNGKPIRLIGTVQDITDRKQAEMELRHRTEQLETLIDTAPLGIYLIDSDFRIAQINPIARPVFADLENLEGRDFGEILRVMWHRERAEQIIGIFQHTLESGEAVRFPEFAEHRADRGATEYYDWRTERILLPNGKYGVVCYFSDISEQVKTRVTVERSETKYRTLFESIDEGFAVIEVIFDDADRPVDYRFIELNPAFERHTGLKNAEGKTARELVPELEEYWFETYGRVARTGRPERFVNHARDMEERWFDVYAFRLGEEPGDRVAILFNDITRQRQAVRDLEELTQTLEERVDERTEQVQQLASKLTVAEQEERRRIARVLHDDLQQLLFAVHLRLEGLAMHSEKLGDPDMLHEFDSARDWVNQSIQRVRDLSITLNPPVLNNDDLTQALHWLADLMRERHHFEVRIAADNNANISDEDLRTLVFNTTRELLFNAVKHSGVNQAEVSLVQTDGWLHLEVIDSGAGFEADGLQHGQPPGGGFGLSTAFQRLQIMGGNLEIQSYPGKGTRARISVPGATNST